MEIQSQEDLYAPFEKIGKNRESRQAILCSHLINKDCSDLVRQAKDIAQKFSSDVDHVSRISYRNLLSSNVESMGQTVILCY